MSASPDAARDATERVASLVARDDPTGTTDIRSDWLEDADGRWLKVMNLATRVISENDAFRLGDGGDTRASVGEIPPDPWGRVTQPGRNVQFTGDPADQLAQFRTWLEDKIDTYVVDPKGNGRILNGEHWTADYLRRAELSGIRAAENVVQAAGYDISDQRMSAERVFSPRDPFNATGPVSRKRWFYETFQELRGHADLAIQRATREVSKALQGPEETYPTASELADAVVDRLDAIGQTRTQSMILTFTVELHNNARLARFRHAGFGHVLGVAEQSDRASGGDQRANQPFTDWSEFGADDSASEPSGDGSPDQDQEALFGEIVTAGDQYVCEECQDIEGDVYPIEQAFAILPRHISCRCSWVILPTMTRL